MKKIIIIVLLFTCTRLVAQDKYWQQYLRFKIDAQLDDQEKSITGTEKIVYINNSPQPLAYIWFHLYPNAYKDESTALFQQIKNDTDRKNKLKIIRPGSLPDLTLR